MRLFEKHANGAIIDMDGEPDRVIEYAINWRKYNDSKAPAPARPPVGFVVETGPSRIPPHDMIKETEEF